MRLSTAIAVALVSLLSLPAIAAELDLVFRHGEPIEDVTAAWPGHIEFASWIDNERIVFLSQEAVTCISTRGGEIKWKVPNVGKVSDWSISRQTKRLAILNDNDVTSVIDCTKGKVIFTADRTQMTKMLGLRIALLSRIAIAPDDGRLAICSFSRKYGRNGYILDPSYTTVLASFDVDAMPRKFSFSSNGQRVATIADNEVLCVQDLIPKQEVFFRGKRVIVEPASLFSAKIDAPFFSHLRDSGGDHLIYTEDNSWATGRVFVHNIKTKKEHSFDGRNGHIELDVSFSKGCLALTGTSTDLTVVDLDGAVIAHKKNATKQRNSAVEFSPTADRILVGSWDNTVSVFSLVDQGK